MEKISIFGNLMVSEEVNSLVKMTGNMMEHILKRFICISAPNCLFSISAQRSDPFCYQRSALKAIFQNDQGEEEFRRDNTMSMFILCYRALAQQVSKSFCVFGIPMHSVESYQNNWNLWNPTVISRNLLEYQEEGEGLDFSGYITS